MKEIVGFDRATVFGQALALLVYSVIGRKTPEDMIRNQNRATKLAQIFNMGLAPSKDMVSSVVSKMPYEPFGIKGVKDTTKFDGNLSQQYKQAEDQAQDKAALWDEQ